MFEIWIFLMGFITTSNTFLLTGMTATIKTYSEHFPWFIPGGNNSPQDMINASTRFDISTEDPKTLKEYLQKLTNDHTVYNHVNDSSVTWEGSKVVVVAKIGDYDNETEWVIIPKPKGQNETLKNNENNEFENITENVDYFLGNDDVQKYLNDYQDLLYTFKDFVKIGANPILRTNILQHNFSNESNNKMFNVTYVMPIPKTKKYFEIKLSNLTKLQYDEINEHLQKHILKKTNVTEISKGKEQEIIYVDENTMGSKFVSQSLSDPSITHNKTSKPIYKNNRFTKDLQNKNEPIPDYFGQLLTPEGFNYFLNNFDSIHINMNNKSVDQNIFPPSNLPPNLIQNNGFHAEIATDYVKRYEGNGEKSANNDSISQTNNNSISHLNNEQVGPDKTILNPHIRRNRTKLFSQTRSKRPIINAPDNVLNTRKRKLSPTSILGQAVTNNSSNLPPHSNNNSIMQSNFSSINNSNTITTDKPFKITSTNKSQNVTANIDWLEMYKLFNSSSTSPDKIPKPLYAMEAAEWIIHMKQKIDEENRKQTERIKSYIKEFLRGDEGSVFFGSGNDSNIMKINKQENILEELKLLMLEYFASLNFITQEVISNNSSSAVTSILNATNIFELMEQSSQLVKSNLQMQLQSEAQEPTKFVKRIVEKQVEKCKKILDKGLFIGVKQNSPGSTQKSGHRRLMVFTKCMNFKLQRCINGFGLWLGKGKFFLRPQFKLERAYENYEIERNLYCLRNYDPSSLGSNPHGIRVKPGLTVNRKPRPRKVGARQNKRRLLITDKDKIQNRHRNRKSGRSNIKIHRKYKQQPISKQRPIVHRYTYQQGEGEIVL